MVDAARAFPKAQRGPYVFQDLEVIRLTKDVSSKGGVVRKGSQGTIIAVLGGGKAYRIEFTRPIATSVTVTAADLEPVNGAAA